MNYEFSLDKKTGLLILGCCVLAAILLLAAGFLIGINSVEHSVAATLPPPKSQPNPKAAAAAGQTPAQTAPEPGTQAAAMAATAPTYCVQFGSFLNKANAGALVKQLKKAGIPAAVSAYTDVNAKTWYVVRSGSYGSLEEAAGAARDLRKQSGLSALVRNAGVL